MKILVRNQSLRNILLIAKHRDCNLNIRTLCHGMKIELTCYGMKRAFLIEFTCNGMKSTFLIEFTCNGMKSTILT